MAKEIDHSRESIRDRIKRYLSRLSAFDQESLRKEAELHPDSYAHFTTNKSRNRKSITHFSSIEPKIAGNTLTQKERRAIMRKFSKKKKEAIASAKSTPKKLP